MVKRRNISYRPAISARLEVDEKVVKSALRTLQILEFFDDVQREATVVEVSKALNYPQSSTSALLRSLVILGYLSNNPHNRTYVPSSRVALLGNWINSNFIQEGRVIQLMRELNEKTGDTIVLAARNGLYVQYIHVIQATSPARLHMTRGTVRPLAASGVGYVILSKMSDPDVIRLINRINAECAPDEGVKRAEVLERVAEVRKLGYAFTTNMVTPGGGVLAAPLPQTPGQPLLVVGIGGITEVLTQRKDFLTELLQECIGHHFAGGQMTSAREMNSLQQMMRPAKIRC